MQGAPFCCTSLEMRPCCWLVLLTGAPVMLYVRAGALVMHICLIGGCGAAPQAPPRPSRETCGIVGELCCMRQALKKLISGSGWPRGYICSHTSPCRAGASARRTFRFSPGLASVASRT